MAKVSGVKSMLEEKVKTLQKHMGAVTRTVKDQKGSAKRRQGN